MSSYEKVQERIDAAATAAKLLVAFEIARDAGEYADRPNAAATEHARLVAAVQAADRDAIREFRTHEGERRQAAQALRLKAEASRDPATRLADEMEMSRVAASPVRADDLAEQAIAMLNAGQAGRARLLWSVAKAKGFRGDVAGSVDRGIDAALDESDADRKAAREIETKLGRDAGDFMARRSAILANSVGVDAEGQAGKGTGSERTSARVAAKMETYFQTVAAGKPYVAPAEDLVLDRPRVAPDSRGVRPGGGE